MSTAMKSIMAAALFAASPALLPLVAQAPALRGPDSSSQDVSESRQTPPAFSSGVAVGTMHFRSGRAETAASATMQYSPMPWLSFSATPGYGHATLRQSSTSGLTDLPLSVGASQSIGALPLSPSISGSIYTALSFADTGILGAGRTAVGVAASVSAWATEQLNLAVGTSRPISSDAGNGSVDVEAAYSLGRVTPNVGFSSEIGRKDSSATLARSIAGGVGVALAGPLTLTIDGSHGVTSGAPSWTFSVGVGTAFAGVSPLNPSSSLRRLTKVLGSRVSATSGYTKSGSTSKGCKTTGTC